MKTTRLEPGLLNIFRLFLIVQFIVIVVNLMVHHARGYYQGDPDFAIAIIEISLLVLFGYLSWPWLEQKLGWFYLPFGLFYSSVFSLAMNNLFLTESDSISSGASEESSWRIFFFLFVPLILISWQYGFKPMIIYFPFITIVDLALFHFSHPDYLVIDESFHRLYLIRFFMFLLTGYIISRIMQQLRGERRALQEANLKLERYVGALEQLTVSRERNRMAHELHDTLAHTLSGVAVELEAVDSLWTSGRKQARGILQHSLKATRDGLTETRKAIQALRATPLENLGLCRALSDTAEEVASRAGFHLDLDLPPTLDGLPMEVEQCFYRIGQEALENAVRHSVAKTIRLSIKQTGVQLWLEIEDDGIGFDAQDASPDTHFGLQGMSERAQVIHATLEVTSSPGKGTRVMLVWLGGDSL